MVIFSYKRKDVLCITKLFRTDQNVMKDTDKY